MDHICLILFFISIDIVLPISFICSWFNFWKRMWFDWFDYKLFSLLVFFQFRMSSPSTYEWGERCSYCLTRQSSTIDWYAVSTRKINRTSWTCGFSSLCLCTRRQKTSFYSKWKSHIEFALFCDFCRVVMIWLFDVGA